ncbi:YfdX family protein [Nitratifractor salsuginis]|uniref:YfdX protein n=1 Tax=Nitratifractor salsuginis (strain DSM 16511 / JCM 12458 / E9I37-1) TaxID=749222 RepID=E6WY11_NITSE|nr:YfdX family protein [Nitratifractor salsuginis]ADV46385.1 hypothetical protein Nitsa_1131 [Nitratifractor salsuginis DSM 16511]
MSEKKRRQEQSKVTERVETAKSGYVDERNEQVKQEAIDAVNLVVQVLKQVEEKKKEEAVKSIEEALGKLEVLVAKDPDLQLFPVDVQEQVVDYPGTVEEVVAAKKTVKELIEKDEFQAARELMLTLASELDIYITALPIGTYPAALKAIVPLIEEEKYDEATALLVQVLETLVLQKVVIPLPIVRAEKAVEVAAAAANDESKKADRKELEELLAYTKEQLLLAQALGYGKVEEDYKELLEMVDAIEKKLEGGEETKGVFDDLLEKLNGFMGGFNKAG